MSWPLYALIGLALVYELYRVAHGGTSSWKKSLLTFLLAGVIAAGITWWTNRDDRGGIACTLEAKQCPDGSYVGRTGPNCEFAACPK